MMVLNDIWLINYLKPFKELFKDREILVSNLFLGGYSLNFPQKQFIKELEENGKIGLFETDLGFYKLIEESRDKGIIGACNAASIYYAKVNNLPIITEHDLILSICELNTVIVYTPIEALKLLKVGDDKIKFIERIINSDEIRNI